MRVEDEMRAKLQAAFAPERLDIADESERHRGHAGWREGESTHFHITIAAPVFAGMSRIERHRAVHAALTPALVARIHALSLSVSG